MVTWEALFVRHQGGVAQNDSPAEPVVDEAAMDVIIVFEPVDRDSSHAAQADGFNGQ